MTQADLIKHTKNLLATAQTAGNFWVVQTDTRIELTKVGLTPLTVHLQFASDGKSSWQVAKNAAGEIVKVKIPKGVQPGKTFAAVQTVRASKAYVTDSVTINVGDLALQLCD